MDSDFQTRSDPDPDYQYDFEGQAKVTRYAAKKSRVMKILMVVLVVLLLAAPAAGFFGMTLLSRVLLSGFGLSLLAVWVMVIHRPKVICSHCGCRMKPKWHHAGGGNRDLFFRCEPCKRFVDTYQGIC